MALNKIALSIIISFLALFPLANSIKAVSPNLINSIVGKGEVENAKFSIDISQDSKAKEKVRIKAISTNPENTIKKFIMNAASIDWNTNFVDGMAKVWYAEQEDYVYQRVQVHIIDADQFNIPGFSDTFWVLIWDQDNHYFDPFGSEKVITGDIDCS